MALSLVVQEVVWLKKVRGLSIGTIVCTDVVTACCVCQAANLSIKDCKYHCKTKHIDILFHFVKDMVAHKEVNFKCIYSNTCRSNDLNICLTSSDRRPKLCFARERKIIDKISTCVVDTDYELWVMIVMVRK